MSFVLFEIHIRKLDKVELLKSKYISPLLRSTHVFLCPKENIHAHKVTLMKCLTFHK